MRQRIRRRIHREKTPRKRKYLTHRSTLLIILGALVATLLFIKFKSFFIFFVIAVIAAAINYFIHATDIHLHLGHVSFFALIFSYTLGFKFGLLIIILAHIIPELLAGHADKEMIISAVIYTIICALAATLNTVPIVTLGLILITIQAFLTFMLEKMSGTPIYELITENGVEFILLIFYFISFAKSLVNILN